MPDASIRASRRSPRGPCTKPGGGFAERPRLRRCPGHAAVDRIRHVVVFDAADVSAESAFWAAMLDGIVVDDDPRFRCAIDQQGNWLVGVQHAPKHVPPDWPDGQPQQVHVDFHVTDPASAHRRAIDLGAYASQHTAHSCALNSDPILNSTFSMSALMEAASTSPDRRASSSRSASKPTV